MNKLIIVSILFTALQSYGQNTIEVQNKDLYQMNRVYGTYAGEAVKSTFWQLETLQMMYLKEVTNDDETKSQLENIIARLNAGTAEEKLLMATELWDDEILQSTSNIILRLRNALIAEANAFMLYIDTKDERYIELIESNRTIVNDFFSE